MEHAISMFFDDSRGVAQPGSATVLGTVGREFESRRPDHIKLKTKVERCPAILSYTKGSKQ